MRIVVITSLLLLCTVGLILAQTANDLFVQAGIKERIEGDVPGAMRIYERITKEFSSNRHVSENSYLRLIILAERLGQAKAAQEYFQQLVKLNGRPEVIAEARKHLSSTKSESLVKVTTPFTHDPWSFAISPDGRSLVFVATVGGKTSLWIRRLDSSRSAPISGTESTRFAPPALGANPFWSPDSRFIGYFEDQKLKTIPVGGGTPRILADAPSNTGGTWNSTGDIIFGAALGGPLFRVTADGLNRPVAVTRQPPVAHRYPRFLGDGRHFLYLRNNGQSSVGFTSPFLLAIGSLDNFDTREPVIELGGASFVPPDLLVFVFAGALFARRLDLGRMEVTGPTIGLADRVANIRPFGGYQAYSVSVAGPIAYRSDIAVPRRLSWRDRTGRETGSLLQPGPFDGTPQFSPDGRTVTLLHGGQAVLVDVEGGRSRRLDFGTLFVLRSPIWSPPGDSVAYSTDLTPRDLFEMPLNGDLLVSRPLLQTLETKYPDDWFGSQLLFTRISPTTRSDLYALPVPGLNSPIPIAASFAQEANGRFSPNGGWIAYESDEVGGSNRIFVQPFPGTPQSRIPVGDGSGAQWSRDGRELYFLSADNHLMVASVTFLEDGRSIRIGNPQPLFPSALPDGSTYSPAPDGRFLVSTPIEEATPIYVLSNWTSRLQSGAPVTSSPSPSSARPALQPERSSGARE